MEATGLRGMTVVSIADATKIGEVEDLLVNPNAHRIAALRLKAAPPAQSTVVPVEEIYRVGRDAITLEARGTREAESSRERGMAESEDVVPLTKLLGAKVLTRGGSMLGTLADVDFEPSNFQIVGYQVSTGGLSRLTGSRKKLRATPGVHYGKDILMVPDEETAAMGDNEATHQSEVEEPRRSDRID